MESFAAFIPIDRRIALHTGSTLPNQGSGAVLFADLSGFTPLTESLVRMLGEQHAAETLTDVLNTVFDALIDWIHQYGGVVISFAGDAITCWFDDLRPLLDDETPTNGAHRTAACALQLQEVMRRFADLRIAEIAVALSLKIVVCAGTVQRLVVGDPQIQLFDLLVGSPVDRLALGELITARNEVLIDLAVAATLEQIAECGSPRSSADGHTFYPLHRLDPVPLPAPWTVIPSDTLDPVELRPWLLPAVAERLIAGGLFLAELRPVSTLFLHFSSLPYETAPESVHQIDAYVRAVQQMLETYGSAIHQIIIGDKGCYLYAACGAPTAYEDDAVRIANAALYLRDLEVGPVRTLQIGVAGGRVRAGAYGSRTRRTYGVIGDTVNLAARLMGRAGKGEILIDARTHAALGKAFVVEPRPPLQIKGRAAPLPVFALERRIQREAARLTEPHYTLPMIGRTAELAQMTDLLGRTQTGQGQVVVLVGEAGIGKSRLLAEVLRLARRYKGIAYGGASSASDQQTAYLIWRPVFQALFGIDPDLPLRRQLRRVESELEDLAPERVELLPLLRPLLELALPENDKTGAMDAKLRKSALEALLVEVLASAAHDVGVDDGMLVVMLEDLHWIDPLSSDLLILMARAAQRLPLMFVAATRPAENSGGLPAIAELPHTTIIPITALDTTALDGLVRAKLAQLYPSRSDALSAHLLTQLAVRSQGNPFFAEELLNYLHDCGIDPYASQSVTPLDLPDTLQRLILARIDQLTVAERLTLRIASVIGRSFSATWLPDYAPEVGTLERVHADLDRLARLELTVPDGSESELTYLFKHIITQEVTYSSLPQRTRRQLHTRLANWLEQRFSENPSLDLLAFHYDRGNDKAKQREYLRRAGDAARAIYANTTAADYYTRLLALELNPTARAEVLLLLGQAQFEVGQFTLGERTFDQAAQAAEAIGDQRAQAESLSRRGRAIIALGAYSQARELLQHAQMLTLRIDDPIEQLRAERYLVAINLWEGDFHEGEKLLHKNLNDARALGDRNAELSVLVNFGHLAIATNNLEESAMYYQEALSLARTLNDRWHIALILANLGELAARQGRSDEAQQLTKQSIDIDRSIGNHTGVAGALINLADMACANGDPGTALRLLREALPPTILNGGAYLFLWLIYLCAWVHLLTGSTSPADLWLRLALHHPAGSDELRSQARHLATEYGIDVAASVPTLESALADAERWLRMAH